MKLKIVLMFGVSLFLLAVLRGACFNAGNQAKNLNSISGKINLREGWRPKLYIVKPLNYKQLAQSFEGVVVDSTDIQTDGTFFLPRKNWLSEKALFRICVQPEKSKWRNGIEPDFEENIAFAVLSPESELKIEANVWEFSRSYKIENADPENALIARVRNFKYWIYQQAAEDLEAAKTNPDALKFYFNRATIFEFDEVRDTAFKSRIQARERAMKKEKASLKAFLDTTHMIFPFFVALQRYNPDCDYPTEGNFYLNLANRFSIAPPPELKNWLDEFRFRVRKFHPAFMVGDTLPDFQGLNENGDSLKFSQFKGKVRLLFFWQSNRKNCRDFQLKSLIPLHKKFSKNGFQIVGYSFDNEEVKWKTALAEDALPWPNLRDPKGRRSDLIFDFGIKEMPVLMLINPDGKILAREIFGTDLTTWVNWFLEN